jgi:alpha-galactosidase
MAKIAFIGAGSIVFAKNLLGDILSFPELSGSTISLMDIDPERLGLTSRIAEKLVRQEGYQAVIESTTDLRAALRGADYAITMLQVGGLEAFKCDVEVPLKHGISQAVGDTLGPGGIFRGLRTIPVLLDVCRVMEELCPEALLVNYVNPMAIICGALNAAGTVRNVGLCHSVQGTAEDLAGYLGIPFEEVTFRCGGINHMCWFLDYRRNGEDCYPLLKAKCDDPSVYGQDVTRFEILRHFGFFVTESSYHASEYVPYFRKSPEWIARIGAMKSWLEQDGGSYYRECRRLAATFREETELLLRSDRMPVERTREYAASIIHAMETGTPTVVYGNVRNTSLIGNLPDGCCVEVPCLVDAYGIQPTVVGRLPTQLAALTMTNVGVQTLAVEAALGRSRDAVYHAVALDPLTASVLDLPRIHDLVDEMFDAEKEYLPAFGR